MSDNPKRLDADQLLDGVRLLIIGGTGFLGKIFWAMMLDRYPQVGKIYLVVRSKKGETSEQRFWSSVAPNGALTTLQERYGDQYEAFLRDKIVPIDGDVGRPECGIDPTLISSLKGTIDAVVNVAGVVDFNPPLDEAIDANAFGAMNLISLARKLGDTPIFHTSTCYVAGSRVGPIYEVDPCDVPYPRAAELGAEAWAPEREVKECLEIVAQARKRLDDAFRQSEFEETARENLRRKGEPLHGKVYEQELANVRRKFINERLVEAGLDRANHWGWPNIYTYTKSIGEQLISRSGLPFTITRPACSESCSRFPFPGWNEGINTSAPLIFFSIMGAFQLPGGDIALDFIPADMVCAGMILSLLELLEGNAKPVYQYGTSDINPVFTSRIGELIGIYKRKYYRRKQTGSPLINFIQSKYAAVAVSEQQFVSLGPPGISVAAKTTANVIDTIAKLSGATVLNPIVKQIESFANVEERIARIMSLFLPFSSNKNGPFDCSNTRAAHARLSPVDREKLWWAPESIDWADWMMEIHMPGLEKWVLPEMEKKMKREVKALRPHTTLVSMLDESAEKYDHQTALGRLEEDGFSKMSFLEWQAGSRSVAARLAARGVVKGDRVILSGKNHPDWPIAYFGILMSGATAVPVDAAIEADPFKNIADQSKAKIAILDEESRKRLAPSNGHPGPTAGLEVHALDEITRRDDTLEAPTVELLPSDVASLIYTSGTTGVPKGVMLTHANFTSLLGSITPSFPLKPFDRVLSVLPLHHTFEFTCGLLLPLSRGTRVYYLDELNGERLTRALKLGRITALVGVPALWQMLERRIRSEARDKGAVADTALNLGTQLNRYLGKSLGLDVGKLLFGPVHQALGGHLKYLISGGAALPKETQQLFTSLGLPLVEGYGLTEAAPVLTVSKPSPKAKAGNVGKALPGIELKIADPDASGVGEVLARGNNVMAGYADNPEATAAVIDKNGWLHTGDLGKLDKEGRLTIVGRIKDVVVTATGENIYPDDVERTLGEIKHIVELALVGVPAPRGGERLACLAVIEADESLDRAELVARAQRSLNDALKKLPHNNQPAAIHLTDAKLPRTSTRKVKRGEVREILEKMIAASSGPTDVSHGRGAVAVAAVAGRPLQEVHGGLSLASDLGFDSLMYVELHAALESKVGGIDAAALQACRTVSDVEALIAPSGKGRIQRAGLARTKSGHGDDDHEGESRSAKIDGESRESIELPSFVQDAGKNLLGLAQRAFYQQVMKPKITGQAYIPHNRNTIVVANHSSHLDMGLVKVALGSYGEGLVSLAAQDYFFERGSITRTYFENFTNLRALDRKGGLRQSLRQAGEILERGETMLLFPEGTRSEDGDIHEFKPMVGHLALTHGVDLLPVCIVGAHQALPKGAMIPTQRNLEARIGRPLEIADLRRLTHGMSLNEASREVSRLAQLAVRTLRDGGVLDLSRIERGEVEQATPIHPLVRLFEELGGKFRPDRVAKPVSFYFTLGGDAFAKWTVRIDPQRCEITPGKPESGTADCVLKTSPEIFTRIVREAYTPGVAEFLSGAVKSNDVELLQTFQKAFALA